MTPTIITAGTLAHAAEAEIGARMAGRPTELHLATASRRFRREAAEAGKDLFRRAEIRSHLPEESPRQFTWRWDRERYRLASRRPARESGTPTRAAGRAGRRRASVPTRAMSGPLLGLSYSIRAREGVSFELVERSRSGGPRDGFGVR